MSSTLALGFTLLLFMYLSPVSPAITFIFNYSPAHDLPPMETISANAGGSPLWNKAKSEGVCSREKKKKRLWRCPSL